jgi:DNA repair protein RecO (recombination protein O)
MSQLAFKGYVIRGFSTGETSRIITIFTAEKGKVKCMAKGLKKTSSRKGSTIQLFSLIAGNLYHKEHAELGTLGTYETLEDYSAIAGDLIKFGYVSAYCEIIDKCLQLGEAQPELFEMTGQFFPLATNSDNESIKTLFWSAFLKTLTVMGYDPELNACVSCQKPNPDHAAYYSPELGGIICSKDIPQGQFPAKISAVALGALRQFASLPLAQIAENQYAGSIYKEIERFIFSFADYHMGLHPNLKSFKFLSQL